MSVKDNETCEGFEPSPMFDSMVYTVFSPSQAKLPKTDVGGLGFEFPANQVAWEPSPNAPDCLTSAGIEDLQCWIDWFQQIIELMCSWKNINCQIYVSGKLVTVGKALAECLMMSEEKPTIVYDPTGKQAVAGRLIDARNCAMIIDRLASCVLKADPGEKSQQILGHTETGVIPTKFMLQNRQLTRMRRTPTPDLVFNTQGVVNNGERYKPLFVRAESNSPNEGNSYSDSEGYFYIGKSGFYNLDFQTFVGIEYEPVVGSKGQLIVSSGILIDTSTSTVVKKREERMYQQTIWCEYGTTQDVRVGWSYSGFLNAGTKLTPRIWFDKHDDLEISVNLTKEIDRAQLSLNRIADAFVFA